MNLPLLPDRLHRSGWQCRSEASNAWTDRRSSSSIGYRVRRIGCVARRLTTVPSASNSPRRKAVTASSGASKTDQGTSFSAALTRLRPSASKNRASGPAREAQLHGAVSLHADLGRPAAVQLGEQPLVPRQHDLTVLGRAVDGRDHIAAERTVSDQPTEQVGEIVVPLLGKRHRGGVIALAGVRGRVGRDGQPSLGRSRRRLLIEQSDPVIGARDRGLRPSPGWRSRSGGWACSGPRRRLRSAGGRLDWSR